MGSSRSSTTSKDVRAPLHASRSRSRGGNGKRKEKKGKEDKKEKEFAWMDSDEESQKDKKASPSSLASSKSEERPVRLEEVQSLGQMARLAPSLEKRLKHGQLRSRELCEVVSALQRSKFFDGGLFEVLAAELRRAFDRRSLSAAEVITTIATLGELNAYNQRVFEAACDALEKELPRLPEALRLRLDSALKQVNHNPSDSFVRILRNVVGPGSDRRQACPMFWRGQCKWGPKCKLSHDSSSFESTMDSGSWRPPSQSGGKSVGFKQSSDLFKADRCGALW